MEFGYLSLKGFFHRSRGRLRAAGLPFQGAVGFGAMLPRVLPSATMVQAFGLNVSVSDKDGRSVSDKDAEALGWRGYIGRNFGFERQQVSSLQSRGWESLPFQYVG